MSGERRSKERLQPTRRPNGRVGDPIVAAFASEENVNWMALVVVPFAGNVMANVRCALAHDIEDDSLCERSGEKQSRGDMA